MLNPRVTLVHNANDLDMENRGVITGGSYLREVPSSLSVSGESSMVYDNRSNDDRSSNDNHNRGISFQADWPHGNELDDHGRGVKADRKLIDDGKPINLAHAYASAQPGFFDQQTEDIRVLLTDLPLAGEGVEAN